jgi:hypothetical protein
MIASANTIHSHSWLGRLIVSLTIGLMMLALGAATAFAGTGIQSTHVAANAAPVISTSGGQVTLDEDEGDEDEDEEDEEGRRSSGGGGGGLPATDTAPLAASGDVGNAAPVISTGGAKITLDEDDCDDDDCEEEGGRSSRGGGGLPATDTAPLAATGGATTPIPAIALLVVAGLAGGAMTVAAKRSVRS